MRNANRIASLIIFAFGIFIILGALKFDYMVDGRPGPGFLPFWVGLSLSLVSLIPLGKTFTKFASEVSNPFKKGDYKEFFIIIGGAIAVMLITPITGFLIALGLMSGATSKLLGTENWKTVLGLTVLIPIFMFAVFDLILGVPLPKGIFGV